MELLAKLLFEVKKHCALLNLTHNSEGQLKNIYRQMFPRMSTVKTMGRVT